MEMCPNLALPSVKQTYGFMNESRLSRHCQLQMSFPDSTMDSVPVEVHEALKTAMEKLQVSKGSPVLSAPLPHLARFAPSATLEAHTRCRGISSRCSMIINYFLKSSFPHDFSHHKRASPYPAQRL